MKESRGKQPPRSPRLLEVMVLKIQQGVVSTVEMPVQTNLGLDDMPLGA